MRGTSAERGVVGVEYLLIAALIAAVLVVVVSKLGPAVSHDFTGTVIAGETTTTVTVLGATDERDCAGRDHAHQGCR